MTQMGVASVVISCAGAWASVEELGLPTRRVQLYNGTPAGLCCLQGTDRWVQYSSFEVSSGQTEEGRTTGGGPSPLPAGMETTRGGGLTSPQSRVFMERMSWVRWQGSTLEWGRATCTLYVLEPRALKVLVDWGTFYSSSSPACWGEGEEDS